VKNQLMSTIGLLACMVLAVACANKLVYTEENIPSWKDSVITVRETTHMTPAMMTAERLAELQRAKALAYERLTDSVLALSLTGQVTVERVTAEDAALRASVEAYVRRTATVTSQWEQQGIDVVASVVVGMEFLELLKVEQKQKPPLDRNEPSTGIVRPIMGN
jgi:hypothetical protein